MGGAFHWKSVPSEPLATHTIRVYEAGTTNDLAGLTKLDGSPLTSPFTVAQAGGLGDWGFIPPENTLYDLYWVDGGIYLSRAQMAPSKGDKGDQGNPGADGADGAAGAAGANGADGRTVLNGSGAPAGGLGANGDFYIDTLNLDLYGPKTAGAWGSPTALGPPIGSGDIDFVNHDLLNIKTATFDSEVNNATTAGAITIDWNAGQNQRQAEPTGDITYTFTAPPGPCHLQLLINSDGASVAQVFTWPASVVWVGSVWAGANNKKAIINFWFDGTTYFAMGVNEV